jgi:uncharacterized protein YfiM (DUF2279 family)
MLCFKPVIHSTILSILLMLLPLRQVSAGERLKTLDTYFKTFAAGHKSEKVNAWFSPDKGYHLIGSMIGTTFIGQLSQKGFSFSSQKSQYIGAGMTFSFGLAKELYDSGKTNNMFSWKDLAANCVGIVLGTILLGVQ